MTLPSVPSNYNYLVLIPASLLVLVATPLLLRRFSSSSSGSSRSSQLHAATTTPADREMPSRHAQHTVVILGAGLAGVPLAHHLLRNTPPSSVADLHVVLVAPNEDMLWSFATVRGILPDQLPDEKFFLPIAPSFAKYPTGRFEHVVNTVARVDLAANTVYVASSGRAIRYDTLVIATGSSFKEHMPFKNLADTPSTKAAVRALRERIRAARSIVVAGAGQTGAEVAGELGQEYALPGTKTVTLIADGPLPLGPEARDDVRRTVARELGKLGVRIVANTRVVEASTSTSGDNNKEGGGAEKDGTGPVQLKLRSSDGAESTMTADLYIPTFGVVPNSSFLPASLLDGSGRVRQTTTLRAEGHDNIFVVGDVGNLQTPSGLHVDAQTRHLGPALQAYLAGRPVPEYRFDKDEVMFAVTLGRSRGTGQMGRWKIWGWIVAYMKGRFFGTDYAPNVVAGLRTVTGKW